MRATVLLFSLVLAFFEFKLLCETPKTWSILIPTLEKRKELFLRIYNKISNQIEQNNLQDQIEILFLCDNGENSTGSKRNALMQASHADYISFVDDDDDVHERYVQMIHDKLVNERPDCITLVGIMTIDGKNPKKFIHSIKYRSYFEKDNVYYRPPNHIAPIRRDIAAQFKFPDGYYGEDTDWAMQICQSGLLQKESIIDEPYYFYLYISNK